jgi:ethanolamine utilization protein EutN
MIIGRVIGRAVSTRKDDRLLGAKLLLVEEVDAAGAGAGSLTVAVDHLGAGPGDVVLVTQGSAARFTAQTDDRPIDALVVGMVDTIRIAGRDTYTKDGGFIRGRPRPAGARP